MDDKTRDFYERLKAELDRTSEWPSNYLFKFIVPSDQVRAKQVEEAFNDLGAIIVTKQSKTGKFTAVSIDVMMPNAQSIVDKYVEVSYIEGIISL